MNENHEATLSQADEHQQYLADTDKALAPLLKELAAALDGQPAPAWQSAEYAALQASMSSALREQALYRLTGEGVNAATRIGFAVLTLLSARLQASGRAEYEVRRLQRNSG